MSMRTAALVAGWVLALIVATGVSWAGVNLVGSELAPSGSVPLSQAEVEQRIHAALGSSSSMPVPSSTPPRSRSAVQRSFVAQGGTVVLECTGSLVTARSSPRSGYAAGQELRDQGTSIRVTFHNGSHKSEIHGSCLGGTPVASVEESGHDGDD